MSLCGVCFNDGTKSNPLITCNVCGINFHEGCYGFNNFDRDDNSPYCKICILNQNAKTTTCLLCPAKGGAFANTENGYWIHVICGMFIKEVELLDEYNIEQFDISNVPPTRYMQNCCICLRKKRLKHAGIGVCITCEHSTCSQQFHVTCAQTEGLLALKETPYPGVSDYVAFCEEHAIIRKYNRSREYYSFSDDDSDSFELNNLDIYADSKYRFNCDVLPNENLLPDHGTNNVYNSDVMCNGIEFKLLNDIEETQSGSNDDSVTVKPSPHDPDTVHRISKPGNIKHHMGCLKASKDSKTIQCDSHGSTEINKLSVNNPDSTRIILNGAVSKKINSDLMCDSIEISKNTGENISENSTSTVCDEVTVINSAVTHETLNEKANNKLRDVLNITNGVRCNNNADSVTDEVSADIPNTVRVKLNGILQNLNFNAMYDDTKLESLKNEICREKKVSPVTEEITLTIDPDDKHESTSIVYNDIKLEAVKGAKEMQCEHDIMNKTPPQNDLNSAHEVLVEALHNISLRSAKCNGVNFEILNNIEEIQHGNNGTTDTAVTYSLITQADKDSATLIKVEKKRLLQKRKLLLQQASNVKRRKLSNGINKPQVKMKRILNKKKLGSSNVKRKTFVSSMNKLRASCKKVQYNGNQIVKTVHGPMHQNGSAITAISFELIKKRKLLARRKKLGNRKELRMSRVTKKGKIYNGRITNFKENHLKKITDIKKNSLKNGYTENILVAAENSTVNSVEDVLVIAEKHTVLDDKNENNKRNGINCEKEPIVVTDYNSDTPVGEKCDSSYVSNDVTQIKDSVESENQLLNNVCDNTIQNVTLLGGNQLAVFNSISVENPVSCDSYLPDGSFSQIEQNQTVEDAIADTTYAEKLMIRNSSDCDESDYPAGISEELLHFFRAAWKYNPSLFREQCRLMNADILHDIYVKADAYEKKRLTKYELVNTDECMITQVNEEPADKSNGAENEVTELNEDNIERSHFGIHVNTADVVAEEVTEIVEPTEDETAEFHKKDTTEDDHSDINTNIKDVDVEEITEVVEPTEDETAECSKDTTENDHSNINTNTEDVVVEEITEVVEPTEDETAECRKDTTEGDHSNINTNTKDVDVEEITEVVEPTEDETAECSKDTTENDHSNINTNTEDNVVEQTIIIAENACNMLTMGEIEENCLTEDQ